MSKQHDKWLSWKFRNGLAHRGRPGNRGALRPVGPLARLLHKLWFHRDDEPDPPPPKSKSERMDHNYREPKIYSVHIENSLSPKGETNRG